MSKEAMKLALEALEGADWYINQLELTLYSADDAGTHENRLKVQQAITVMRLEIDAQNMASKPAQQALDKMAENARKLGIQMQPAQQEPVNEGWKLVPVEPTEDMWKAVNKLDDEMAAGSYDGKGCSIEQAWNCLLDAAPTPPAQRTWVGLTDEERIMCRSYDPEEAVAKTEAKLREKNA